VAVPSTSAGQAASAPSAAVPYQADDTAAATTTRQQCMWAAAGHMWVGHFNPPYLSGLS
jgi:hypothetical protein